MNFFSFGIKNSHFFEGRVQIPLQDHRITFLCILAEGSGLLPEDNEWNRIVRIFAVCAFITALYRQSIRQILFAVRGLLQLNIESDISIKCALVKHKFYPLF